MTLRAVREHEQVVDFVWDFVSVAAAQLLGYSATALQGQSLRNVLVSQVGGAEVFNHYRRTVEDGAALAIKQVHGAHDRKDIYRHDAMPLGGGVAVRLTNLSAARRAQALRLAFNAQQAAMEESASRY